MKLIDYGSWLVINGVPFDQKVGNISIRNDPFLDGLLSQDNKVSYEGWQVLKNYVISKNLCAGSVCIYSNARRVTSYPISVRDRIDYLFFTKDISLSSSADEIVLAMDLKFSRLRSFYYWDADIVRDIKLSRRIY